MTAGGGCDESRSPRILTVAIEDGRGMLFEKLDLRLFGVARTVHRKVHKGGYPCNHRRLQGRFAQTSLAVAGVEPRGISPKKLVIGPKSRHGKERYPTPRKESGILKSDGWCRDPCKPLFEGRLVTDSRRRYPRGCIRGLSCNVRGWSGLLFQIGSPQIATHDLVA